MTKKTKPAGFIDLNIFNMQVAVFTTDEDRVAFMHQHGAVNAAPHDPAAIASAHIDEMPDGSPRLSMVLKPHATTATWAHECSHVADFVCDILHIDLSMATTEVRAYLVGYLMARLNDILGKDND